MVHYKLTYFNGRGRAEVARQILAYAGVPFEDVRIDHAQFAELKSKTTFGQVPMLEVDGKVLCQSMTISRYLARQFGLTGANDWEAAKMEELADGVSDLVEKLASWFREKDPEKKKELYAKLTEEHVKPHLALYEKFLTTNGTGFFVGSKISWFDILMAESISTWQAMFSQAIGSHPKLIEFSKKIQSEPKLKKWIENRPKTEF